MYIIHNKNAENTKAPLTQLIYCILGIFKISKKTKIVLLFCFFLSAFVRVLQLALVICLLTFLGISAKN